MKLNSTYHDTFQTCFCLPCYQILIQILSTLQTRFSTDTTWGEDAQLQIGQGSAREKETEKREPLLWMGVCACVFSVNERATLQASTLLITHSVCRGAGSVTGKQTHGSLRHKHTPTHIALYINIHARACTHTKVSHWHYLVDEYTCAHFFVAARANKEAP